ncbi:hypothetical protein RJ55_08389 [Drechmeria coniospora]|nr:hypothetical protein RJ55_08389 [Drechmeria coniospora]
MNSLKVPETGLLLEGSPEGESAVPRQAFVISLSDLVVGQLIQSARNGDKLNVSMGSKPSLHFGTRSHQIAPPTDDAPYDLYLTKPFESSRRAERVSEAGSLFAKPTSFTAPPKTAAKASKEPDIKSKPAAAAGVKITVSSGLDSDIEALQNGLAAHDAARERAHVMERLPANGKASSRVKNKLWAGYNPTAKSMPSSPALNGGNSPLSTTSLSVSQQTVERKKEQRFVLVHELAVRDRTTEYLQRKWRDKDDGFRPTLEKTAVYSSDAKLWTMKKACWKELDVWRYDYDSQADRETAIDNAIRQFDKQRLSPSEVEWQRLLPKEERGQGKCLSRLQANIAKGPPQTGPRIKVHKADDGVGPRDDDSTSDKSKANGDNVSRSTSTPLPAKAKKVGGPEAQAKRLLAKAKPAAQKVQKAPAPASASKAKAGAGGSRSGGGRVLSAAIIENSDSSEDEAPMRKAKSATPQPKLKDTVVVHARPLIRAPVAKQSQAAKRPRDDDDSTSSSGTPLSKRIKPKQPQPAASAKRRPPEAAAAAAAAVARGKGLASSSKAHANTSPTKSSPLASSPPTNASDLEDDDRPLAGKRKAEAEIKAAPAKRRPVQAQGVPAEVMAKAHKFKTYYQKYTALHYEVAALADPPEEKMADLHDMRDRLEVMKTEIYKQCSPGV